MSKELIMEVRCFFNNLLREFGSTILGGFIVCDSVKSGEEVEVITPTQTRKTKILGIKHFSHDLKEVYSGTSCGLLFHDISDLDFRTTEAPTNPYNPNTHLEKFIEFEDQSNITENITIYREVNDATSKEENQRDCEGHRPKPNFLFLRSS